MSQSLQGSAALTLAFALGAPCLAQDRHLLFKHPIQTSDQCYAIAPVGDINADGHADYVATRRAGSGRNNAEITAFSGYSGLPLWATPEVRNTLVWGPVLAAVDDRDGDGLREIAVGDPTYNGSGDVSLYDGATGQLITRISATTTGERFGGCVSQVGDIDGDGTRDYAIGSSEAPSGSRWGLVSVYSGVAPFGLVRSWFGYQTRSYMCQAADMGDIDADGRDDLAMAAPGDPNSTTDSYVRVMSTRFSLQLWEVRRTTHRHLGMVAVADRDADGVKDLVVLWKQRGSNGGQIILYSGRTGAVLATHSVPFPTGISAYPDLDGDGVDDIGIGGAHPTNYPGGIYSGTDLTLLQPIASAMRGFVTLGDVDGDGDADYGTAGLGDIVGAHSVDPLPLTVTPHAVSVTTGGLAAYSVDAGPAHAGKAYLMAGSMSGFDPGFSLLSQQIPLNLDAYTLFTVNYPNVVILTPSFGFLDASGRATVNFSMLPKPALAGFTFHHSVIVFSSGFPATLGFDFISNARPASSLP